MIEEKQKNRLKVKFVGDLDWKKLKDLLILKFMEADTEEKFSEVLEMVLASMFSSVKEMNSTRKRIGLDLLSKKEESDINNFLKENK